jgi:hypothetical protein
MLKAVLLVLGVFIFCLEYVSFGAGYYTPPERPSLENMQDLLKQDKEIWQVSTSNFMIYSRNRHS